MDHTMCKVVSTTAQAMYLFNLRNYHDTKQNNHAFVLAYLIALFILVSIPKVRIGGIVGAKSVIEES